MSIHIVKARQMKNSAFLHKICGMFLLPAIVMGMSTCSPDKDETNPEDTHCQSNDTKQLSFIMDESTYERTYYAYKEGDYIRLCYFSNEVSGVCSTKGVTVEGMAQLSKTQAAPVQVIARLWWNRTSPSYSEEIPLEKTTGYVSYIYGIMDPWDFDISGFFPSGSAAKLSLSVEFKFFSSGDNVKDQDYLKSVFTHSGFYLTYYPY